MSRARNVIGMAIGIEDRAIVSPATWPAVATIPPGDLTQFAPAGLGLTPPAIVQPWDALGDLEPRASYYGANARRGDPFGDAPVNEPAGGTLYFDGDFDRKQFAAALVLLDVQTELTHDALFAAAAVYRLWSRPWLVTK